MRLPDFLIIGAARSATTAVSMALQAHPQVHIPFKEPNYFSGWGTRYRFDGPHRDPGAERVDRYCGSRDEYAALFARAGSARVVGEASVSSLPAEGAAELIRETAPRVKLIALLRQPVDRAFSHFGLYRRYGVEPERDFRAALRDEPARVQRRWHPFLRYGAISRYADQVAVYMARFPPEQLRIYLHEDWTTASPRVWAELMAYLELDDTRPDLQARPHEGRVPYRAWSAARALARPWLTPRLPHRLRRALRGPLDRALSHRPTLDPDLRQALTRDLFREDILRLQDLIRRDLTAWL